MDPLSQAVTGSLLAQWVARREELRIAAVVGALAGMAPDLDVFIRSSEDPLLQVEFHRHFTHALAFIPIGALLCALIGYPFFRRWIGFGRLYLFCFLGFLQGGLLDACTSYGTRLLWPFVEMRVAWSNIAIIDPLYTIPALVFVILAASRRRRLLAGIGCGWIMFYLLLGVLQRERAEAAGRELADSRQLKSIRIEAKPSIFNNFLFRVVTETEDRLFVDAIRVGWFSPPIIYPGDSVPHPSDAALFAGVPEGSRLRKDIERFAFFADDWVYFVNDNPAVLGDFRYALLPNSAETLWTLQIDRANPERHGQFETRRALSDSVWIRFGRMLQGKDLPSEQNSK